MSVAAPEMGDLVRVRGQHWVVIDVKEPENGGHTLVDLLSVSDGGYGQVLKVVWEIEPGRRVLETETLPEVTPDGFDDPAKLAAFLDAVRWSAVTSADTGKLQAPFRSGVKIESYQLEPVSRALKAPRVNLLIADDVGLGKTIEAGLVALELLLRNRAKKIMVVCPAGLTVKWHDEMAEKFGLDFKIVNSDLLKDLRRTHGLGANPFRVFPLTIVSLSWLRGPRAQRLLDEALGEQGPAYRKPFDLLIVDEAHHVAPAAPQRAYAVDSQQTKVVRRLAQHFQHRLFLSATPHNGYTESFTALLEMIEPQRFARGVAPDRRAQDEVVVRRLKDTIGNPDGSKKFPGRDPRPIVVEYPENERQVHDWLGEYAERRRKRLGASKAAARAADLVTLLLKKRLFSSPAAFAATVDVHKESIRRQASNGDVPDDVPAWLQEILDEDEIVDDGALAEAEDDALTRSARLQPQPTSEELELLDRMERWALTHEARADAKAKALLGYIQAACRPDGRHWTNERVVIFTEYRDTQRWLANLLEQAGLGGDRLALLHGGMNIDDREHLREAFQAHPVEHPVRILLATDAASEGIDLQRHCHRMVNYDIPFNPNKLEQRIGRIDRYGQRHVAEIRHFVGAGWEKARPGSYEADLEFLSRVAVKVARMEQDLGAVNAVLAQAVQDRMLGRRQDFDVDRETTAAALSKGRKADIAKALTAEGNVTEQVARLRAQLDDSIATLHISPATIERVVSTALELARQQSLEPVVDGKQLAEGLYRVPTLTKTWARATANLPHKLTGEPRPITFDPSIADGRDDVVLAHLGHPLTAMSIGLLRAAMWSGTRDLRRVTAVISDDSRLEAPVLAAYGRLVLVGRDGSQLHEEVFHAGVWLKDKVGRVEGIRLLDDILDHALNQVRPRPAAGVVRDRLAGVWPKARGALRRAIEVRAETRKESLVKQLEKRRDEEITRVNADLDRFEAGLRQALATETDFGQQMLDIEITQHDRDRREWQRRLDTIEEERHREVRAIEERYRVVEHHVFPAAVVCVVPEWEAAR